MEDVLIRFRLGLILILLFLVACSMDEPQLASPTISPLLVTFTPEPTFKNTKPSSPIPSSTPTMDLVVTTTIVQGCPPIPGYSQLQLIDAISNPFNPPSRPGSDDPHQAVDLAVTENGLSMPGSPVHAMLDGITAAVISDRFPYGNALLVETGLDSLPLGWIEGLTLPTPAPTLGPHPSLTCPHPETPNEYEQDRRSLYILYAHMGEAPALSLDEPIRCGEEVGVIGQSGNALNPHLHLEARIGPAGARFEGLAHYETRASPEEMWGYCQWRVSGWFQLVDPTSLIQRLP